MRSPAVPPNHQSSSPATQIDASRPRRVPPASRASARTSTSPETPGASSQTSSPCAFVLPAHDVSSFVFSCALS